MITDIPGESVYYQNPFYDSLFGFFDLDVPSKRVRYDVDHAAQVVHLKLSESGARFEAAVRESLTREPRWPFTQSLLVAISITLQPEPCREKDVDNIAKSILDALKGLVYDDDRQVASLFVAKRVGEVPSFFVGIRELRPGESPWYLPSHYATEPYPGQNMSEW